ncbi:MAG: SDR family oxidoreductase [Armatimonadota bacterium]|nr:SDR family oxidoreductase [Armatimonadota bacterium]
MSSFLVTGGAGFIGSHVVELLVSQGHDVRVFDNFSTGRLENLEAVSDRVEIIRGDIRDLSALETSMQGIDYVLHLAAEVSVVKSLEEPLYVNEVNVTGTLNVLAAAKNNAVKRVVMSSSCAVYGDTGRAKQSEDTIPAPLSPYGASKIAGEYYMSVFHTVYGLETVRLRYFNVFGPRQNPASQYAAVIPKFIDRILKGQDIHIYGDGEQTRDFVYVENVARANYLACTAEGAAGRVFNIASERSISVNELAQRLLGLSGKHVRIVHDPPIVGEVRYSHSDISRARTVLGYEPWVGFEEGLERTYRYFAAEARSV